MCKHEIVLKKKDDVPKNKDFKIANKIPQNKHKMRQACFIWFLMYQLLNPGL